MNPEKWPRCLRSCTVPLTLGSPFQLDLCPIRYTELRAALFAARGKPGDGKEKSRSLVFRLSKKKKREKKSCGAFRNIADPTKLVCSLSNSINNGIIREG